jgi:8-oxo-dGTP diphosphatase
VAADVIVELDGGGIVLIERKNPPHGWAIPGGFLDAGESAEDAARRELAEETGLEVELTDQLYTYSDPHRDPRGHTVTIVFVGRARGVPCAGDDAARAAAFDETSLPTNLAFDHDRVLAEYFAFRRTGKHPKP